MRDFTLAVAWTWDGDAAFVRLLERRCAGALLSFLSITRHNLAEALGDLQAACFLDRASDEDPAFLALNQRLREAVHVNPIARSAWAADKATMHLELLARGIHVPYTIILGDREPDLAPLDLPFVVKPAMGGGGTGVFTGAKGLDDVRGRSGRLLLQQKVVPRILDGRRAWFRTFCVFGEVWPCWWDDQTHHYRLVTAEDEERFRLAPLRAIARQIADICRLDFFSTEIALSDETACSALGRGRARPGEDLFVVIDYVNDPCDLRLQSEHADGVPDLLVQRVADQLVSRARSASAVSIG